MNADKPWNVKGLEFNKRLILICKSRIAALQDRRFSVGHEVPICPLATDPKRASIGACLDDQSKPTNTGNMERLMSHVAYQEYRGRSVFSLKGLFSALSEFVGSLTRRAQLHRAELHLAGMDDRMLNDIGLDRADIHSAVFRGRRISDRRY
jgi:uncharacterized protein YjiS (DUF1127 family)